VQKFSPTERLRTQKRNENFLQHQFFAERKSFSSHDAQKLARERLAQKDVNKKIQRGQRQHDIKKLSESLKV
jgi:hypothetical protein